MRTSTKSFNKIDTLKYVLLPIVIVSILMPVYLQKIHAIPFRYWDEYEWVGRSYFFEFYSAQDFNHPVWSNFESYDQPKLTELVFGYWLSSRFAYEFDEEGPYPYTAFLLKNGFTSLEQEQMEELVDIGSIELMDEYKWIDGKKYSDLENSSAAKIVYQARMLNVFIMSLTVVVTYYLLLLYFHPVVAGIAAVYYGLNSLIMQSSLVAHSEALFLLTFTAALFFLILYLKNSMNRFYLLLFSLSTGLCASVKLNGIMLLFILCAISLTFILKERKISVQILKNISISFLISFLVFVLLNPFTHSSPVANTVKLFQWRVYTSSYDKTVRGYLDTPSERLESIISHFSTSEGNKRFDTLSGNFLQINYLLLTILTIGGLLFYSIRIRRYDVEALVVVVAFVVIVSAMSIYLYFDWPRYYVQLVLLIVIFQISALKITSQGIHSIIMRGVIRLIDNTDKKNR